MVEGTKVNQVVVKELKKRLNIDDKSNLKLLELLDLAYQANKITDLELEASLPTTETTIKCYLYSIIEDPLWREIIDKYVLISSKHFTRGSLIANLICVSELGDPNLQKEKVLVDLFKFIKNENSTKQLFLPERWPTKDTNLDPKISEILSKYENILEPHYDSSWNDLMDSSGWDNLINRSGTKYRVNVQNHILNHLPKHLKAYCKEIVNRREDVTDKKNGLYGLFSCLKLPLKPITNVHHIVEIRDFLGIDRKDYIPCRFPYSENVFLMFMKLTKIGITKSDYFPVANIERKYCYIDAKVCRFLFNEKYLFLKEEQRKKTATRN